MTLVMEKVSIGKLFSKDKTDFGKSEVTSGKEKSEDTAVKVALQAVIRENYRTFRSYGIMRNLELRPFDYSFGDRYWEMKNESVIKNSTQIHFENFDIKNWGHTFWECDKYLQTSPEKYLQT